MRGLLYTVSIAWIVCSLHGRARAAAAGEGTGKTLQATRTASPPRIDGSLDDAVWAKAKPDDRFTQSFPKDGAPPSFRTTVRVLFDDDAVYIGVNAFDPDPASIVARLARRDNTVESDHISIVLDARHDHDTGFWFWLNAAGVTADGQVHNDNRTNTNWDGVWRGRSKITATGWTAEVAIPHSLLRFPARADQTWGFNLTRFVARTKEVSQWVHIPQSERGNLSRAGHIVGLSGIKPKRALELRPFVVLRGESTLPTGGVFAVGDDGDVAGSFKAGVDLKVGLTNNLTLDATVLPDFGQVEADAVVLNLSTFETQFGEKRPFFLENADIFDTDIGLFYSRRIGGRRSGLGDGSTFARDGVDFEVTDAPLAVPIWAATRVSGKVGHHFTVAALDALTGPETVTAVDPDGATKQVDVAPIRNFAALRGKYSLGGSSYLGFIATARNNFGDVWNPSDDHDGYAEAIDGRWVAKDGAYRAYFMFGASHRVGGPRYTETDQVDSTGRPCTDSTCTRISRADGTRQSPGDAGVAGEMGGGKVGGDNWLFWANYQFATPHFDVNDVGFESDWDYHSTFVEGTYREQKPFSVFQNASMALRFNGRLGWNGLRKETSFMVSGGFQTRSFLGHSFWAGYRPAGTWTTRETSDGARFERIDWTFGGVQLSTDSRKRVKGYLGADGGFSGTDDTHYLGANGGIDFRVLAPVELSLSGGFGVTNDDLRFVSCTDASGIDCSLRSQSRDYLMARLDSSTMSFTLRGTWAMSTRLSLQVYSQLFAARGRYHDYGEILAQTGSRPYLTRDELSATGYTGDSDGDGVKDDDFEFATLNANVVLRWEPTPGTTVIGVYTRAQSGDVTLAGADPGFSFSGLRRGSVAEVVLAKLTLYYD